MSIDRARWLPWGAAFLLGLLIGWFVLGWGLFPVRWTNTDPGDLRPSARQQYLDMVAESFALTGDVARAQVRLQDWSQDEAAQLLAQQFESYLQDGRNAEAERLGNLAVALGLADVPLQPTGEPAATPAPETGVTAGGRIRAILMTCLRGLAVLLVIAGLAVLGLYLWRRQRAGLGFRIGLPTRRAAEPLDDDEMPTPMAPFQPAAQVEESDWHQFERPKEQRPKEPPRRNGSAAPAILQEFIATYDLSAADNDQTFTIEDAHGNYQGECGMGLVEKAQGTHEAARALEVWLFDKSDIRTVTRVLMSDHAFGDAAIRSTLATKGDPMLAMPGQSFMLETQTLVAAVEVTEIEYANTVPPRSGMARLSIRLRVSKKSASD